MQLSMGLGMIGGFGIFSLYGVLNFIISTLLFIIILLLLIGFMGLLNNFETQKGTTISQPPIILSNELPKINNTNFNKDIEVFENIPVYGNSQVLEIVVSAYNMTFEPKIIRVEKGTRVKLTFKNEEEVVNNFVIEGINVKTESLEPNTEQTVEFLAEQEGEFDTKSTMSNIKSRSGKFIVL